MGGTVGAYVRVNFDQAFLKIITKSWGLIFCKTKILEFEMFLICVFIFFNCILKIIFIFSILFLGIIIFLNNSQNINEK